jgi:hypothetical protein
LKPNPLSPAPTGQTAAAGSGKSGFGAGVYHLGLMLCDGGQDVHGDGQCEICGPSSGEPFVRRILFGGILKNLTILALLMTMVAGAARGQGLTAQQLKAGLNYGDGVTVQKTGGVFDWATIKSKGKFVITFTISPDGKTISGTFNGKIVVATPGREDVVYGSNRSIIYVQGNCESRTYEITGIATVSPEGVENGDLEQPERAIRRVTDGSPADYLFAANCGVANAK